MGVFEDGVAVCPEGMLDAGQEDSGRDSAERDSGGGSDQGERSVLYVCPTADQYATIRAAIQAASDGDTIELCCGIPFTGEGNRNIESEGKSLTIRSSCAIADSCVLDCEGRLAPPNSARRAFLFERGDNVLITGLTVYDGKAYAPPDSG
jgi:hypothetical protein